MADATVAGLTPAQTVGPFLHLVLADPGLASPVPADDPDALWLGGVVVDGDGAPVPDAVVETWAWGGPFARCATGKSSCREISGRTASSSCAAHPPRY